MQKLGKAETGVYSFAALVFVIVLGTVLCACSKEKATGEKTTGNTNTKGGDTMKITSTDFEHEATIPQKYTGDGQDVSPRLEWEEVPEGTNAFVLIADDPDAPGGTFVHWVIYDISPSRTDLPENVPNDKEVLETAEQGKNSFGKIGYGGPAPPPGKPHRYYFKLYAVDQMTELKPGAEKAEVLDAIEGHILAESQVMGKYQR